MEQYRGTTILSVRRDGKVVIGGDGQVSLGNTIMKGNARKVRRIYNDKVIAGFAGDHSLSEVRNVLYEYTEGGGDGGLTRATMRKSCSLEAELERANVTTQRLSRVYNLEPPIPDLVMVIQPPQHHGVHKHRRMKRCLPHQISHWLVKLLSQLCSPWLKGPFQDVWQVMIAGLSHTMLPLYSTALPPSEISSRCLTSKSICLPVCGMTHLVRGEHVSCRT